MLRYDAPAVPFKACSHHSAACNLLAACLSWRRACLTLQEYRCLYSAPSVAWNWLLVSFGCRWHAVPVRQSHLVVGRQLHTAARHALCTAALGSAFYTVSQLWQAVAAGVCLHCFATQSRASVIAAVDSQPHRVDGLHSTYGIIRAPCNRRVASGGFSCMSSCCLCCNATQGPCSMARAQPDTSVRDIDGVDLCKSD